LSGSGGAWHYLAVRTPVLDAARPFIRLGARIYFRIRFEGVHHVPPLGPLLIVPNHVTYADPVLATIPVRRPVHYMAWKALFQVRGLAWLIRRLRAFPVDIDAADAGAARAAVRLLSAGEVVMIFPEAGRSLDGRIQRFRLGAFRLACSLGVPIMPVTIVGGHECWPPSRRLPRPGRLTIVYHPVLAPSPDADVKRAARDLAHRAHAIVASALPAHQRPDAPPEPQA
jgi:1-acyl-sn-glycerol-3-phosphate acyltransferase